MTPVFARSLSFPFIVRVLSLVTLTVSLLEPSAHAANRTWKNSGTDFNTAGNWTGGVPTSSDVALFNVAASIQPNLSASLTIQELNFSTTASSGYDLTSTNSGIKLTLTNTGTGATSAINAANTSGTNTINAPIILGAAAGLTQTFTQAAGGTLVVNGIISNTNTVTLSLAGGIIQLAGANTYSGGTTLASGTTLNINNATALGTGTFTINGGTIDNTNASGAITLTNNNAQSWNGDFTFTGTKDLNLGTGAVTMNASRVITVSGGNLTVGGAISGATFGITKAGTGTLILNGAIGTTTGSVTVNASSGTLTLAGNNTYSGGTTLNTGSTLNINSATALGTGTFTINGGTIDNTTAGAITLTNNNAQAWNGDFTFAGTQSLNLGTGAVTMNASRIITVNGGTLTVGGAISGATFGITKAGTGTLTLSGASTYTGKTTINNGTLSINTIKDLSTNSAIGAPTTTANGTIAIGSGATGATLKYTGTGDTTNRVIDLAGTTGGATIDQSGTGLLKFTSDLTATGAGTKTLTLQGSTAGTGEIAGKIVDNSGANKTNVTKAGTGTWTLSGANTYTGTTTINGGTLKIDNNNTTTPRLANTSGITVNSGGTLLLAQSGGTASTDRINDAASVTIKNGGTFNTAGLSEGSSTVGSPAALGALTLEGGSTIDFKTGANGSTLLASSGVVSGLGTISILNWTGLARTDSGAATNDRLLYVTDPSFSASQLSQFQFYDDSGALFATGAMEIAYNGFTEIVPVPEPSTYLAGFLALGAIAYSQRQRVRNPLHF